MWMPWTWLCVRLLPGGAVNRVGLSNKGLKWFLEKIAPTVDFDKYQIILSLTGSTEEILEMISQTNHLKLAGYEINKSCPNEGKKLAFTQEFIDIVKASHKESHHPIIVKVSVDQDYLVISRGLVGIAQAISINSVPWKTAFPNGERSPLWKLERKLGGGGGGGVSGKPAQKLNWKAVKELTTDGCLPVIAPSIMKYEDIETVMEMRASAASFGTIHMASYPVWLKPWTVFTNPCKPTQFIERKRKENK
jgi:dihydroorotate dehydrogenase